MVHVMERFFVISSHENNLHPDVSVGDEQAREEEKETPQEDFVYNYHRAKLAFGLVLLEFDDAIKEGDGERLHDLYKFILLLYKAYGKTKYAYAVLLYLVKIEAILSEEEAHDLQWNRSFNKYGLPGKNIPLDLRTEQFNKDVKAMWRALQANISEKSAERVANTVEPMEHIRGFNQERLWASGNSWIQVNRPTRSGSASNHSGSKASQCLQI